MTAAFTMLGNTRSRSMVGHRPFIRSRVGHRSLITRVKVNGGSQIIQKVKGMTHVIDY